MQGGSVNPMVGDYSSMEAAKDTKTVTFRCDYDKVARGDFKKHGDYCGYAKNSDYVSYFIPPDAQSTNAFQYFIAHNAKFFSSDGLNSPYKYYQFFSGMNIDMLKNGEFDDTPPTGFAIVHDGDFVLGFTRKELLARLYISPSLVINAFKPMERQKETLSLNDYEATYQITPYKFTLAMALPHLGRLLGLPDAAAFPGALSQQQQQSLKLYDGLLNGSLAKRDMNRYASIRFSYLHPYLAKDSSPAAQNIVQTAFPPEGEGFINEYLPSYKLDKIEIFVFDKNGALMPVKTFKTDDIMRVIISPEEFPALLYRHRLEKAVVRYTHTAIPPKREWISELDILGAGFIFSDMAENIQTDLHIERFYNISGLSKICINETRYVKRLAERGYNQEDIKVFQSYLKDTRDMTCTPNQLEIIEHLPEIILKTVPL
jgi:hypothetical protein